MEPLRRALTVVRLLNETTYGATIGELADELGVCKRTISRLITSIGHVYTIHSEEKLGEKRFLIEEALARDLGNFTAQELGALNAEAEVRASEGAPHAPVLASIRDKILLATRPGNKVRVGPDLEVLARLQRMRAHAGPCARGSEPVIQAISDAILQGRELRIDYKGARDPAPRRRLIEPWGILLGPVSYLCGKDRRGDGIVRKFRVDRISRIAIGSKPFSPPADWDFDAWLAEGFHIFQGDMHDIVLRARAGGVEKARQWQFHPAQTIEDCGDELRVRFRAGGLREIAEHLFTWGDEIVIEGPEALRETMRERLAAAGRCL
ncbi:MAG: WYL domain-containing transcriptional regulator [Sphingomonadales bacterium]|nr:WYL domain-containing transcriptional regulator [Sphingomonadales bacterium]